MSETAKKYPDECVALVTGSSRGLGRDIALRLADIVSAVIVHGQKNQKAAREVSSRIRKKGKRSDVFMADLTDEAEVSRLFQEIERRYQRVDILINNVGPILIKPWEKTEYSEWDKILSANLGSAFSCMKAVLPGMRKRKWGRIINLGYSRAEQLLAFPTITPYAAAKTSLLILTRTAAATETASGITVNMVSPGVLEGGKLSPGMKVPEAFIGKAEDIAEAICFLVSDKARMITGTHLIVGGGWKV